jgi:hypothetical protein
MRTNETGLGQGKSGFRITPEFSNLDLEEGVALQYLLIARWTRPFPITLEYSFQKSVSHHREAT